MISRDRRMKVKQKTYKNDVPRIFGNYSFDSGTTKQVKELEKAFDDLKRRIRKL